MTSQQEISKLLYGLQVSVVFPSSELVRTAVVPAQVKTGKELSPKPNFVPEGTGISQEQVMLQNVYYLGLRKPPKAAHGILPFLLQTPLVEF